MRAVRPGRLLRRSISLTQSVAHVFLAQAIYPNQFVARFVTPLQHDGMPGELHLFGEKADQRCIRFSFDRGCAQFDLNCAAVLAHDTVAHGIRNDVNPQNCHSAHHISAEVNSLDGFWRRMR